MIDASAHVPMARAGDEAAEVDAEVRTAFDQILGRGVFRWGPEAAALEQELGQCLQAPHVIAVSSGGVAITIALKALGVGPGDDVVMPPNVDVSISAPVTHAGARIVWCDVDEATLTMDADLLDRTITPSTRAVLVVHLFGNPADMNSLCAVARAHDVVILEDASHGPGASWMDRPCGTMGRLGILSCSSGKPLGCAGSAGVILTADPLLAQRARVLANYGLDPSDLGAIHRGVRGARFRCVAEGFNASLDEWQSAILRIKLRRLPEWIRRRREQAEIYGEAFAHHERVRPQRSHRCAQPVLRHFAIRVADRDWMAEQLSRHGIASGIGYAPPLHMQAPYRGAGTGRTRCPRTECVTDELLTLPINPFLTRDEVRAVSDAVVDLSQRESIGGRHRGCQ